MNSPPFDESSAGRRSLVEPDNLLGDEVLQAPKIAIPYAKRLEVRDGVVEILRARSGIPARPRQNPRDPFQRQLQHDAVALFWTGPEDQGAELAGLGLHLDPAHHVRVFPEND